MSISAPGIDVIEIERITSAIERRGKPFLERLFTESEQAYCERSSDPAPCYAARFAAKEAVAKALGCGIGDKLAWHDIEIRRNDEGMPYVVLSDAAKKRFGNPLISLSISHSHTIACAIAIRS